MRVRLVIGKKGFIAVKTIPQIDFEIGKPVGLHHIGAGFEEELFLVITKDYPVTDSAVGVEGLGFPGVHPALVTSLILVMSRSTIMGWAW